MLEELTINNQVSFSKIFENTDTILVQGFNQKRESVYWIAASEKLFDYSQAEVLGRKVEDIKANTSHFSCYEYQLP